MLITLKHSPFQCDFTMLIRLVKPGDDVLLLQDGVIAALKNSSALNKLTQSQAQIYALNVDVEARGLSGKVSDAVSCIDYTDFIALAVRHPQQLAW